MKTELNSIFSTIKSDFYNLIDYKIRGNTLEVITSVTTISNQFVSVFISKDSERYIVSDGGWIDRQYYHEESNSKEEEEVNLRVEEQLRNHYGVKISTHKDGTIYNFKTTKNEELISLLVVEMSNFIASLSNNQTISYLEEKIVTERKMFSNEVNNFLKHCFGGDLEINDSLKAHREELSNVKFNAIIRRPSKTFLLMYVTGYNTRNFIGSASEAIVNFQISKKYTSESSFGRTAIINTHAVGFNPHKVTDYLKEIRSESNQELVEFYEDRDKIFNIIPLRAS